MVSRDQATKVVEMIDQGWHTVPRTVLTKAMGGPVLMRKAMTHHPHVHMIVPGGGFSLDGRRWVSCRPRFFLSVEVLSALFRPLFLAKLRAAYQAGALQFFGKHARLMDPRAFVAYLAPLWNTNWVVYCKRPFGGPKEVLRYLARYTHRVAFSNRRLLACA